MNPDISVIADVAAAWFSSDEPLQTGGHDPTVTGFNLQQLELALSSSVDPYFRMDGNIVFSLFGVEVEEIYATTTALPGHFQIRAGQFLTKFGRINATHPHTWDFVDQTFVIGRVFGGEGNRGLGAEASVLLPLPWSVELAVSETMADGASTARSFYGGDNLGVETPLDLQTTAVAEQFFPFGPDWSLLWGLSWASGPNPTGRDNRTEVYGTDVYLKWRPVSRGGNQQVELQTEVMQRRRQVPGAVWVDHNGYVHVVWRFAPRWAVGERTEYGSGVRDLDGDRVEDTLDPEWSSRYRHAVALTFWGTEFSRLRLQGSMDLPRWRADPDYAVFLAFEFNAGAHGAHAF